MRDGYWVIRTYQAGAVGEKTKYWVEGNIKPKITTRVKSEIRKQEQNAMAAVKTLARIINANFKTGDYLIGNDYSEAGMLRLINRAAKANGGEPDMNMIRAASERELELYFDRVRRECAKRGVPFRYIAITSDMDGETGEAERVHHHMIVNAEALEICKEKWTLGGFSFDKLSRQPDYTPVAAYFIRQVRHIKHANKFKSSRNLVRPEPKDRIAKNGAEIRVPRGAVLLHRSEYRPGGPQYIRYVKKPEENQDDETKGDEEGGGA